MLYAARFIWWTIGKSKRYRNRHTCHGARSHRDDIGKSNTYIGWTVFSYNRHLIRS